MQEPRLIYTDNPVRDKVVLGLVFPAAGSGFMPGDSGIRDDMYHVYDRIKETFSYPGHPLAKAAMDDLRAAMRVLHDDDRDAYLSNPARPEQPQLCLPHVRELYPPPHHMVQQLAAWGNKWLVGGIDVSTGQLLFTVATLLQLERLMESAAKWYLSGKHLCDNCHCLLLSGMVN